MASYPTSVFSPSNKSAGQTIQHTHVNDLQDEVVAIESGLRNGTAPLQSSGSTVATLSVAGGSTFAGGITVTGSTSSFGSSVTISSGGMTISSGGLAISTGIVTLGQGQVAFPATQIASADANTLDYYDERTFEPTITFGGAAVGVTYGSTRGGYAAKIGKNVFFQLVLEITDNGSSSGAARIGGLPFTSQNSNNRGVTVGPYENLASITGALSGYVDLNATTIALFQGGASDSAALTEANIPNTSLIYVSGWYPAAA